MAATGTRELLPLRLGVGSRLQPAVQAGAGAKATVPVDKAEAGRADAVAKSVMPRPSASITDITRYIYLVFMLTPVGVQGAPCRGLGVSPFPYPFSLVVI